MAGVAKGNRDGVGQERHYTLGFGDREVQAAAFIKAVCKLFRPCAGGLLGTGPLDRPPALRGT